MFNRQLLEFKVRYHYKKYGYTHTFMAYNEVHARQLAAEYEKKSNKGECKSDRIRFDKIIEVN